MKKFVFLLIAILSIFCFIGKASAVPFQISGGSLSIAWNAFSDGDIAYTVKGHVNSPPLGPPEFTPLAG